MRDIEYKTFVYKDYSKDLSYNREHKDQWFDLTINREYSSEGQSDIKRIPSLDIFISYLQEIGNNIGTELNQQGLIL